MSYYLGFSCLSGIAKKRNSDEKKKREINKYILSRFCNKPIEEIDIGAEAGGRPFANKGDFDFNISDSGHLTAITFVNGANLRTGCDIERIYPRPGAAGIANEFFSDSEIKYLYSSGSFNVEKFYEIWTLKECFIKLRGLSVFDMANVPSFVNDDELVFGVAVSLPLSFGLFELVNNAKTSEHYMAATVIEGIQQQPIIKWFSQYTLDCRKRAEIYAAPADQMTFLPFQRKPFPKTVMNHDQNDIYK